MSRIINGINRLWQKLVGPLAAGSAILVLYLWFVEPSMFIVVLLVTAYLASFMVSRINA